MTLFGPPFLLVLRGYLPPAAAVGIMLEGLLEETDYMELQLAPIN
jgi:hypothetical protein